MITMSKVRDHCQKIGFEVVGKLSLAGKWDLSSRYYTDEAGNAFIVDTNIGVIRIVQKKKKEEP